MKKEVFKYLAGRFIPAAVSLTVIILAVRLIGTVGYARYSLVLSVVLLSTTLSYHWIQVSMLRFLGSLPRETDEVTGRFFDLTLLSAVFSTAVVVLAGYYYFHLRGVELAFVAIFSFLNHFYHFHQAVFEAYHCTVRSAILEGADQVIVIAVLLIGLFMLHLSTAVVLFASLAIGRFGVLVLRSAIRKKGLINVDMKHFYWDTRFSGKVVEFGFDIALWLFFSQLLMSVDRFVIVEYLGYHEAGVYSVLKDLIFKGVTFSILPIYLSYQNKIVEQWNANHKQETWKMIKEAISFEILIFIIVFIAFMVVKEGLFTQILKIRELDNWLIYLPVLISAFTWQMILFFTRFLSLSMNSGYVLLTMGMTVMINIVLNIVLLPSMGIAASSISLLIACVFYLASVFFKCLIAERRISDV